VYGKFRPGATALALNAGQCFPVERKTSWAGSVRDFMPKTRQERGKAASPETLK